MYDDDYMMKQAGPLAGRTPDGNGTIPLPPRECFRTSFEGFFLRMARRPGGRAGIYADDVSRGIGSDMTRDMKAHHARIAFLDIVIEDGITRSIRLIDRQDFFSLCQLNSSPRLDNFREKVSSILEQIEDTGHYDASANGSPPPLPADVATDQITAQLQLMLQIRADFLKTKQTAESALQLGHEAKQREDSNSREIQDLRREIGRGPGAWTTPVWLKHKGIRFVPEVPNRLGRECRKVCLERGIAIPEEKACNGSSFDSRMWPVQVIEDAWDRIRHQYGK